MCIACLFNELVNVILVTKLKHLSITFAEILKKLNMKKFISILFVSAVLIAGCNNAQNSQSTSGGGSVVELVNAEKFKSLIESGTGVILDVRTQDEVNMGFIKGASHIDIYDEDFARKVNMIPKDKPVYVYCKAGSRSAQAADLMAKSGFTKVYNLQGGVMAWQASGYELVKPEGASDGPAQISKTEFDNIIKSEKPVLVDFSATWCVPCKKMAPVVEKLKADYNGKATVITIDIDAAQEIVGQYKVEAIPTFILFKNGTDKFRHTGMIGEEELKKAIEDNL